MFYSIHIHIPKEWSYMYIYMHNIISASKLICSIVYISTKTLKHECPIFCRVALRPDLPCSTWQDVHCGCIKCAVHSVCGNLPHCGSERGHGFKLRCGEDRQHDCSIYRQICKCLHLYYCLASDYVLFQLL